MSTERLRLVTPMIMELNASVISDAEPHVHWSVGYATELDDNGERFILAHLHAVGEDGIVEVEIGASQIGGDFGPLNGTEIESFEHALSEAESLDLIYDLARTTARGLCGTIDSTIPLPLNQPEAEITALVRTDGSSRSDDDRTSLQL